MAELENNLGRRVRRLFRYALLFATLLVLLRWDMIPPNSSRARMNRILLGSHFDFLSWEAEALLKKFDQQLTSPQNYLDATVRKQLVFDYLQLVSNIQQVRGQINLIFIDPQITDPLAASAELRAELQTLLAKQDKIQGTAEAILEEQVSSVLIDEGFGYLGQVLPPVSFHFTPLPTFLIFSPRDHIEMSYGVMLRGDLALERIEEIETQIAAEFDVSALIEPIGGLAVYPAMLQEATALSWVLGTIAHEWTHHYYFFWLKPVGLYYESRPDARTINETAADIAGGAIRELVVERYYPELIPTPTAVPATPEPDAPTPPPEPPAFDFIAEMRQTRINVDQMLADGEIEKAECYMEIRRRHFVENGWAIRKLNQAYFAFHGAYAASPGGGAAGANPVGSSIQEIWRIEPSLKTFLDALGPVTSLQELQQVLSEMQQKHDQ